MSTGLVQSNCSADEVCRIIHVNNVKEIIGLAQISKFGTQFTCLRGCAGMLAMKKKTLNLRVSHLLSFS